MENLCFTICFIAAYKEFGCVCSKMKGYVGMKHWKCLPIFMNENVWYNPYGVLISILAHICILWNQKRYLHRQYEIKVKLKKYNCVYSTFHIKTLVIFKIYLKLIVTWASWSNASQSNLCSELQRPLQMVQLILIIICVYNCVLLILYVKFYALKWKSVNKFILLMLCSKQIFMHEKTHIHMPTKWPMYMYTIKTFHILQGQNCCYSALLLTLP